LIDRVAEILINDLVEVGETETGGVTLFEIDTDGLIVFVFETDGVRLTETVALGDILPEGVGSTERVAVAETEGVGGFEGEPVIEGVLEAGAVTERLVEVVG